MQRLILIVLPLVIGALIFLAVFDLLQETYTPPVMTGTNVPAEQR